MSTLLDRHMRRRMRLFRDLHGRDLHEAYLFNARVRADLAAEAAYGTEHYDESLLTPEAFADLRAWAALTLQARRAAGLGSKTSQATSPITPVPIDRPIHKSRDGATVIIVPGGFASCLTDFGPCKPGPIWVDFAALCDGRFEDLRLAAYAGPDREVDFCWPKVQIGQDGPVPVLCGPLNGALRGCGWQTSVFAYDWRKDMMNCRVAGELMSQIDQIFTRTGKPVHIITHSQGCLVARLALRLLAQAHTTAKAKSKIGHVILLGPSNFGTFIAAIAIAASMNNIPNCKMFEFTAANIQCVLASFTALYQLMPWDACRATSLQKKDCDVRLHRFWENLHPFDIDSPRLAMAFPSGDKNPWAQTTFDPAYDFNTYFYPNTSIILGRHPYRGTAGGVTIDDGELVVTTTLAGDAWVADAMATIDGVNNTYWANHTGHIQLPMSNRVINAILNILDGCSEIGLATHPPPG